MPLNGEERTRQEEYKRNRKHFARLTPTQIETLKLEEKMKRYEMRVFELERDLNHSYNTNTQLSNTIDRLIEQRDIVNGAVNQFLTGERSKAITLDTIIQTMGWKR